MYVDCSLRSDAKKEKLIDELNFKKCVQLKRLIKSKFFVVQPRNYRSVYSEPQK